MNKYLRTIRNAKGESIEADVYDILTAYPTGNEALSHLVKKALCAGSRGHKDRQQDLQDIIDSAIRAKQLEQE